MQQQGRYRFRIAGRTQGAFRLHIFIGWYWQSVLRLVLDRIPREKYGLKSWNQAAGYIMGKGISCTSCQEAREALTEYSLQRLEDRMDWREDVRGGRHK